MAKTTSIGKAIVSEGRGFAEARGLSLSEYLQEIVVREAARFPSLPAVKR